MDEDDARNRDRFARGDAGLIVALISGAAPARHPYTLPGVLRIGVARDIDSLDPLLWGQSGVTDLAPLISSGLIRYDKRGNGVPDIATALPTSANGGISSDGRTITYHLRRNVRFSDGSPLTADDVVFTWQADLNPLSNIPYHFPYDLAPSLRPIRIRLSFTCASLRRRFLRDLCVTASKARACRNTIGLIA